MYAANCVDDGSDDVVESGSGSETEQSGSGFDADDFFTSGDVTSRKPAHLPADNDAGESSSGARTIDIARGARLMGGVLAVCLLVRLRPVHST